VRASIPCAHASRGVHIHVSCTAKRLLPFVIVSEPSGCSRLERRGGAGQVRRLNGANCFRSPRLSGVIGAPRRFLRGI
jgi:hypothetical protein